MSALDKILASLPALDESSPDKPAGVTEVLFPHFIEIADFDPSPERIYCKKPKKSAGANQYWESDLWYIYDTVAKKACRVRLHLIPSTISGVRYKYKFPGPSEEDLKRPGARFPIKDFQIPLRLQKDTSPTDEETQEIQKLEKLKDIAKVQFFRWKSTLKRDGFDWSDLGTFKNADKFIKWKLDEKGERVEGRGPTLTAKLYKKEKAGAIKDGDGMLYPEQWLITSTFINAQRKQMNQAEIRQLVPDEVGGGKSGDSEDGDEDGGDSKFLVDIEPILYVSKIRWAAGKCAMVAHIPQSMVFNKRASAQQVFTGFRGASEEESSESAFLKGGASENTESAKPAAATAESAQDDEDDEESDEEEEVEAPAPAPIKPGLVPAMENMSVGAAPAARSRRAPPKKS